MQDHRNLADCRLTIGGLRDTVVTIVDVKSNGTLIESSVRIEYKNSPLAVDFGLCQFELLYQDIKLASLSSPVALEPDKRNMLQAEGTVVVRNLLGQPRAAISVLSSVITRPAIDVNIHGLSCPASQWATAAIGAFNKTSKLTDRALITALGTLIGL